MVRGIGDVTIGVIVDASAVPADLQRQLTRPLARTADTLGRPVAILQQRGLPVPVLGDDWRPHFPDRG